MADVERYPKKLWDWYGLSYNPNITMADVERYPEKPWRWDCLSKNPNITMADVERHPDKPWNWGCLSYNKFNRANAAIRIQRWYRKRRGFRWWKEKISDVNWAVFMSPHIPGVGYKILVEEGKKLFGV